MIRRLYPHPWLSLTLVLVWMLLVNRWAVGSLVFAVIVGTVVPLMTAPYWPEARGYSRPGKIPAYVGIVVWDIIKANFVVARIVLFMPRRDLRPAWIVIPLELRRPEAITALAGTITLTAGLGGMGGAQPLAVTMNDGVALCIDCDETRIDRRIEHRYLDVKADDLDHAVALANQAKAAGTPLSIGLLGNAADLVPELLRRHTVGDITIDVVTDQTSAHDPLSYLPQGYAFADLKARAAENPERVTRDAQASMAAHVAAMVGFQSAGAEVFDYGNSIRAEARCGFFQLDFHVL